MAIFCTEETIALVEKYRGFLNEAMHKQVSIIMGKSKMMEEAHVNMFEEMLNKNYDYIENIRELPYKEKVELLWGDIFACIETAFDKYQKEDSTFSVELSVIEREVATILTPLVFDDLFYYSRELKDYRKLGFLNNRNVKSPTDVVNELFDKLKNKKYVPYKEAM